MSSVTFPVVMQYAMSAINFIYGGLALFVPSVFAKFPLMMPLTFPEPIKNNMMTALQGCGIIWLTYGLVFAIAPPSTNALFLEVLYYLVEFSIRIPIIIKFPPSGFNEELIPKKLGWILGLGWCSVFFILNIVGVSVAGWDTITFTSGSDFPSILFWIISLVCLFGFLPLYLYPFKIFVQSLSGQSEFTKEEEYNLTFLYRYQFGVSFIFFVTFFFYGTTTGSFVAFLGYFAISILYGLYLIIFKKDERGSCPPLNSRPLFAAFNLLFLILSIVAVAISLA